MPPAARGDGRSRLPDDGAPTIAVLGAVGPDKGARRLERLVGLVRARAPAVRFVLIGYMDVEHGPWQSDDAVLTVHGRYDPRDAAAICSRTIACGSSRFRRRDRRPSASRCPRHGRPDCPVIVPPFGALAERVAGTGAGWLWTDAEWRDEAKMLARMMELVAPAHADALTLAAGCAPAIMQVSPAEMAARTLRIYDVAAAAAATTPYAPFDTARVRLAAGDDASMPVVDRAPPPGVAATPFRARIAATVQRLGASAPGRLLYRLTPARVRSALKARLR